MKKLGQGGAAKKGRPRVLILADTPGWIVDRCVDKMISQLPFDFTKRHYAHTSSRELLELAENVDLVHYGNSDLSFHRDILGEIKTPFLISVRSHRWADYTPDLLDLIITNKWHTHAVNRELAAEFSPATYIPDGIFEQFRPKKPFVVGFAGRPDDYKGFPLIAEACRRLGVKFVPATGSLKPKHMPRYYRSLDLLVSASVAEGHGTPILECMAMNIPVVTTDVGAAKHLKVTIVERSVEGIMDGILRHAGSLQVLEFTWEKVNAQFGELYNRIIGAGRQ